LITDSGFYSTKNDFIYFDSLTKITAKNSINYIYYPIVGIAGLLTIVGTLSSTGIIQRHAEIFIIPIVNGSLFFGIYQMATGFKRTYTINENAQLLYFTDVNGVPNKLKNK
jgi:hypothetical protein